jgi:L-alanine-DL-glutamate epimerase-like enolase superfamily enzyme
MHVKKVDVFPLAYEEPNDDDAMRYMVLVRLEASDGTVGWGECISQFLESTLATATLIENGLVDVVLNQDPLDTETLWEAMRQKVWWYGDAGGIAAFGISAVDMALWDLKGKILGVPLYQLLGGKQQERLPVCASTHPRAHTIEAMAEELAGHIANGYQLVKVGFGKKGLANLGVEEARDIAFVRAVREAIGSTAGFIVDIGAKIRWTVPYAVRMARAFAECRLTWLEDPFPPINHKGYASLRQAVPDLLLATGERLWNLEDYHRLLEANVCDIILIDPGRTEGVTGMHKITQLAAKYNVAMDAHTWSSAINTAASIHLSLCATRPTIFELKPAPNPMQHELVTNPIAHKEGWIYAPEGPGLGVDVIEDVVRKYTMKR